jgi:hypothetical protein
MITLEDVEATHKAILDEMQAFRLDFIQFQNYHINYLHLQIPHQQFGLLKHRGE